jgi:hypothetical protein
MVYVKPKKGERHKGICQDEKMDIRRAKDCYIQRKRPKSIIISLGLLKSNISKYDWINMAPM